MSKIAILFILFSLFAQAQFDGFEYEFDKPAQVENSVLIQWTLISGSTCNGTTIERSSDSINYKVIGGIDGICGSANFNILYDFTDNLPVPNTRNYYRLNFNRVGYSESLSVFVVILDSEGVLVIPNPVTEKSIIHFKNSRNEPFVLSLYDYNGKLVKMEGNLTEEKYVFERDGLPKGVYLFHFSLEGEVKASGKVMIL